MEPARVYLPWPDGRLRYACAGCGACCKGHGLGLDAVGGELVRLRARHPALTAFLRARGEAITAFTPRDRCWFYADDGRCGVEVEAGRAAKPASCRLFPFNRVFRIGGYTIVDVDTAVCPLTVTAPGEPGGVRHADVLAELATIADPALVETRLPAQDPAREGAALVEGEGAIAAAVFAAPGALDAAWAAQADGAALARERAIASEALEALVGAPWRAPSPSTRAAATWLTPSLRFRELYGPRQYAPRSAMAPVLARMWLAWLGFAALGEELAGRPLGLQALTGLWAEQAPLLHVVARWLDTPALRADDAPVVAADPGGVARALAAAMRAHRGEGRTLGDLIVALPGDTVARVTGLKAAEALIRAAFARSA